ncbi:MAG: ATP-binding protein [Actinomycetes bacterium]|jgi:predicted AAA+ superfamily ATPase|nr:ATP-binding protein [Actinomycetes bacterium]
MKYQRPLVEVLLQRMQEPRHFMQVLMGPRQTGKTTALTQALAQCDIPCHFASIDSVLDKGRAWIEREWNYARAMISNNSPSVVLALDEVQNVSRWSSVVKALWDADARSGIDLRVILTGSSSLMLQSGLTESLMGRFELIRCPHWSLTECRDAFKYTLDDYLTFGGYPGAAALRDDLSRWRNYMQDAIIEATLSKDVLALEAIRKPALLRQLFFLGSAYSGQEVSYKKLLGQLDDAGNVTTLAHYLELLAHAGLLCGLQKYSQRPLTVRNSSPRLMAYDPSLMAVAFLGAGLDLRADSTRFGHLVESAVGAYLLARGASEGFDVYWWRDGNYEVDFVIQSGSSVTAIEVKSGQPKTSGGIYEFIRRNPNAFNIVVGDSSHSLESFLLGKVPLFNKPATGIA